MSNDNFDPRLKPCPLCGGKAFLGFYVDGVDNSLYTVQIAILAKIIWMGNKIP